MDGKASRPAFRRTDQLQAINLINKGTNVFDDFDDANKNYALRALLELAQEESAGRHYREQGYTVEYCWGPCSVHPAWGPSEDGMAGLLPLLEIWRSPFVRVRQGAFHVRHLRARRRQGEDLVRRGVRSTKVHDQGVYWPPHKVPDAYMDKLRNWAVTHNVKFGKPSDDVKTEPAKAMVAYDPSKVSWSIVNGAWVESKE